MNEEMMNKNIDTEIITDVAESYEENSESGGKLIGLIVCAVGLASVAGTYLYKTRDKRKAKKEARMVEKLKAAGYDVEKIKVDESISAEESDEVEE